MVTAEGGDRIDNLVHFPERHGTIKSTKRIHSEFIFFYFRLLFFICMIQQCEQSKTGGK